MFVNASPLANPIARRAGLRVSLSRMSDNSPLESSRRSIRSEPMAIDVYKRPQDGAIFAIVSRSRAVLAVASCRTNRLAPPLRQRRSPTIGARCNHHHPATSPTAKPRRCRRCSRFRPLGIGRAQETPRPGKQRNEVGKPVEDDTDSHSYSSWSGSGNCDCLISDAPPAGPNTDGSAAVTMSDT
jgi:hypothetical protein